MTIDKKRIELTFGAKDSDLWQWLESQEVPKATKIKEILRMHMNDNVVSSIELEQKIKQEVQRAVAEIQPSIVLETVSERKPESISKARNEDGFNNMGREF